jgi:hypothetical protein
MAKLNYSVSVVNNPTAGFRGIRFNVTANFEGVSNARIYLDGSGPPAFAPMSVHVDGYRDVSELNLAQGVYRVDYEDDNGEKYLGKFQVYDAAADTCYSEHDPSALFGFGVQVFDDRVRVTHDPGVWLAHTIAEAQANANRVASVDEGVTFKALLYQSSSGTIAYCEWTNSELSILGIVSQIDDVRIRRNSNSCVDTLAYEINLLTEYSALLVDYDKTNATAVGAEDGTITLAISGGSGNYSFVWADGPATQNRIGLAPGFYTVTVTDNITGEEETIEDIQITEPVAAPVPEVGTVLEFSPLQSLHFVVDPIEPDNVNTFQGLDNVMFCKQRYGLFEAATYEQKVCKVDAPVVQFNSDFANHEVTVLDEDGEVVETIPVTMVENNVGRSVSYPVSIQYHGVNTARVYFSAGTPPLPLDVGDVFEVLNNLDGFNGTYAIVDIIFDNLRGYAYLIINLNYSVLTPTSAALGRFGVDVVGYNVFEFPTVWSGYEEGLYQVKVRAFDTVGSGEKVGYSEPILLKEVHDNTVLVEFRNEDNAFNMLWNLGYIGRKRVEGIFGHRRNPGGEMSTTRNASYDLIKTSGKPTRGIPFEVIDIPPYLYEALNVIVSKIDFVAINKVIVQTGENFSEPQYQEKYLLLNASVTVEQIGWFRQYNSDDVGSVPQTGFVASDGGLVKST